MKSGSARIANPLQVSVALLAGRWCVLLLKNGLRSHRIPCADGQAAEELAARFERQGYQRIVGGRAR